MRAPSLPRRRLAGILAAAVLSSAVIHSAMAWTDPPAGIVQAEAGAVSHIVVSEVMTGGTSASDEFVELYNPSDGALATDGLELVYVTSSGATVTRKASWTTGTPALASHAHLLIANESGIFASIADATYAGGLAATGGSVALRIIGAATAIDAVGWGSAASTWLEGAPAAAPAAGHSLERLPGGAAGSGTDTDRNALDFYENAVPDPQNTGSAPISPSPSATASPTPGSTPVPETPTPAPSATPDPTPTATATMTATPSPTPTPTPMPSPTPTPTPTPSPTPTPVPLTVAEARAMPDGSTVVVEAVALTDADFSEGGGYLADATAGIAVLLSDGTFERGERLRISGIVDDRYYQRTIRADAAGVLVIGPGAEATAASVSTGEIGEPLEGELVAIDGVIQGGATSLSAGLAFDLDDGTGIVRVLVGGTTGIDTSGWTDGAAVRVQGVVGQRDATGGGTAGYRVQPRDPADVLVVLAPTPTPSPSPTPTASASASATATPSASASPGAPLITIAEARATAVGASITVRGTVTMPSGLIDAASAVIQDDTGAILLRLGDAAGELRLGQLVEVSGAHSTKSGMEAIRVSQPPRQLGDRGDPTPRRSASGALGEDDEALLVVVRGAVDGTPRRSSSQNVYFDLDDGSGPIRVYLATRAGVDASAVTEGAWLEIVGVLAQETTGKQPERGYRVWPRRSSDVTLLATTGAAATRAGAQESHAPAAGAPGAAAPRSSAASPAAIIPPRFRGPAPGATGSAAPALAGTNGPAANDMERSIVIGLLLASSLLLLAAAWLVVLPRRQRIMAVLAAGVARLRGPVDPASPSVQAGADALDDGLAGPISPALQLVPMAVAEQPRSRRSRRAPVIDLDARRGGGRILPPT